MNRKQRRQLGKAIGKDATSSLDLMLNMPTECSVCQAEFDKKDREKVTTWIVQVYKSEKNVVLTCPKCYNKNN